MDRVRCFVLAGGKGTRLYPLTRYRAKPALPFAGVFRLIDFTLSNCRHSGLRLVDILVQHQSSSIAEHVQGAWTGRGRSLRADLIAPDPFGFPYRGTADAVWQNLDRVRRSGAAHALILSGDHVYAMDYRPFVEFHRARRADLTIAATPIPLADAGRFGVFEADSSGRIRRFWEKPIDLSGLPADAEGRILASMGVYVFSTAALEAVLEAGPGAGDRFDFGQDIIPEMLAGTRVYAYSFARGAGNRSAYWRDVGTLDAYYASHMELLRGDPGFLSARDWPFLCGARSPASRNELRLAHGNLLCGRSHIEGNVTGSIIADGVVVERGARVESSILLRGAHVRIGADVRRTIVDEGALVDAGVGIGVGIPRWWVEGAGRVCYTPEGVAVVFAGESVRAMPDDIRRISRAEVVGEEEPLFRDAEEIARLSAPSRALGT
ncbi:MAG: NTP transferase domain-containing protein [Planctomycetes bacterium]|nr:NTP transferase domain-containing protein [Planctomycetota bacterium]